MVTYPRTGLSRRPSTVHLTPRKRINTGPLEETGRELKPLIRAAFLSSSGQKPPSPRLARVFVQTSWARLRAVLAVVLRRRWMHSPGIQLGKLPLPLLRGPTFLCLENLGVFLQIRGAMYNLVACWTGTKIIVALPVHRWANRPWR